MVPRILRFAANARDQVLFHIYSRYVNPPPACGPGAPTLVITTTQEQAAQVPAHARGKQRPFRQRSLKERLWLSYARRAEAEPITCTTLRSRTFIRSVIRFRGSFSSCFKLQRNEISGHHPFIFSAATFGDKCQLRREPA